MLAGDLYMFPRADGILLGGSHAEGDWTLAPDLERKQEVLAGQQRLFDSMRRC
ncbi:MAG: hypothetical protein ABI846_03790 [Rudaea sp.]